MHPRRTAFRKLFLPILATVATFAASSCSSTDVEPVAVAGEYVMDSFDGAAMKAHPDANTTVDTGFALLQPSGDYQLYVRTITNGSPLNYINESGTWSSTGRTVQFSGAASDNVDVAADGTFTLHYLLGIQHSLHFHRVGDLP